MKTIEANLQKVVRLGTGDYGDVFCKIEVKEGRLSISGVEGPKENGNARGSCGQIEMSLKPEDIKPAPGWTVGEIGNFLNVWRRWHLNDMRAGCEHQRGLDTSEKIPLYYFRLSPDVSKALREARKTAEACIAKGNSFTPTPEQTRLANLPDKITSQGPVLCDDLAKDYIPNGPQYEGDHYNRLSETKFVGHVYPTEHPKGLLMKPCEVCGYKYGSAWLREELPADVIDYLRSLPSTDKQPAWV